MQPEPLTNSKIQRYYQHENEAAVKQERQRFNGVYSRNNLPKIMDGA